MYVRLIAVCVGIWVTPGLICVFSFSFHEAVSTTIAAAPAGDAGVGDPWCVAVEWVGEGRGGLRASNMVLSPKTTLSCAGVVPSLRFPSVS